MLRLHFSTKSYQQTKPLQKHEHLTPKALATSLQTPREQLPPMPRPSGPGTQQNSPTHIPGLPFLAAPVAPGPTAAASTSGATLGKASKSSLKSANRSTQNKCMARELLGQILKAN